PYSALRTASASVMSWTCQATGATSSMAMCSLWTRVPAAITDARHRRGGGGPRKDPPTGRFGFVQPAQPASNACRTGAEERARTAASARTAVEASRTGLAGGQRLVELGHVRARDVDALAGGREHHDIRERLQPRPQLLGQRGF